jgi:hypothetical protein
MHDVLLGAWMPQAVANPADAVPNAWETLRNVAGVAEAARKKASN